MELTGTVVRKPFAPSSKSTHEAVFLSTEEGAYKLEREEGNPYSDPELEKLVGSKITGVGNVLGYVFRMRTWKLAE